MYPYIINEKSITMFVDGKVYTVWSNENSKYNLLKEAIKDGDWEFAVEIATPAEVLKKYVGDSVEIVNGEVLYQGSVLKNALTSRLLRMWEEGFDVQPMVNFLSNLMQNPSKRSVDDLYRFLDHNNLPITEDGHFLAYKYVTVDYKDAYTRTMDNSVGSVVEMPRNEVQDDPNITCSYGLHFASIDYVKGGSYGVSGSKRLMVVKINPKDVVSVPTDYNNAKARCCRYEVVAELQDAHNDYLSEYVVATVGDGGTVGSYYNKRDRYGRFTK